MKQLFWERPPWVTPAPMGWPDAAWALMFAVRYLMATIILMAEIAALIRVVL